MNPFLKKLHVIIASHQWNRLESRIEDVNRAARLSSETRSNRDQLEVRQTERDVEVVAVSLNYDVVISVLRSRLHAHDPM
jgi:hypothetical protein